MSLTSDSSSRLFFVTGNDNAHQNTELAASGRVPIGTLGQAIVNLNIDPETSKLSLADYFQPYDYIPLDGGDRDLGSSGIALLESSVFKGNSIQQIGCTAGKNGKAYIVDMNNLGGFKNGPGGGDSVLQTLPMPGGGPIFGGIGSCPLDGGYI
jgi:iron transport multicopper oxidase